jgi:pimeloyl-ACP methyl ester carboxylesterase
MMRRTLLAAAVAAAGLSAAHAAEHRTVSRGEVRIALTAEGGGPAVVLIPSLGRGQEDYDGVAPRIAAAGFRVLRPEPRGIGGSTPLAAGETLHDMAADIAAVIEAEPGAAPAIVVGHAAGNWVARMTAHDRPDLVRGVAMVASVLGTETDPDIGRSINGSFDLSLPDEERLAHLRRAYFAPGNDARVWLEGWHPPVVVAQRAARAATRDRDWLRAAERTPLLYLGAAQDAVSPPPTPERLRAAVGPNATLRVIDRAGHALMPEQPAAVADALVSWARSLP